MPKHIEHGKPRRSNCPLRPTLVVLWQSFLQHVAEQELHHAPWVFVPVWCSVPWPRVGDWITTSSSLKGSSREAFRRSPHLPDFQTPGQALSTSMSFLGMFSLKSSKMQLVTWVGGEHKLGASSAGSKATASPAFCHRGGVRFFPVESSNCLKPSTPIRATAWPRGRGRQASAVQSVGFLRWSMLPSSSSCWMQFVIKRSTWEKNDGRHRPQQKRLRAAHLPRGMIGHPSGLQSAYQLKPGWSPEPPKRWVRKWPHQLRQGKQASRGPKAKQQSSTRKNRHNFDTWLQAPWRCYGLHPGDPDAAQIPKSWQELWDAGQKLRQFWHSASGAAGKQIWLPNSSKDEQLNRLLCQ